MFDPSHHPIAPVITDKTVGTAAIVIILSADRGAIANGRKACAAFTLNQPAKPSAPLRYRPVHRAHTGN